MNTNQSVRLKEFSRKQDEARFSAYINNFRIFMCEKSALQRDQLIRAILSRHDDNIALNYTDNTHYFGEGI
ncbi:hypothetical protein [Shewanella sp.]|uniref:hypothetical protein n=1 Tax=Shewanella sp. TaxID=50422 RepID=UPI00356371AE